MRAIAKTFAKEGLEIIDVKIPEIKEKEVLIKVKMAAICGTDVHIYKWDEWAQSRIKIPQIIGHEFCGEVVEVGKAVSKVKKGDFVSAETHIVCGRCIQCLSGQMHLCSNLKILGVDCDGCFAEYVKIPEDIVWINEPSLPPEIAAIQEPFGNAVYCTLVEPVNGKSVLIMGAGPQGLFATAIARASGATLVIVVEPSDFRRKMAKELGADVVINPNKENVEEIVMEMTKGVGVDVFLDMAGIEYSIKTGLKLLRKGGRFSAFGIPSRPISINFADDIIFKGITIYGINGRLMFDTWVKARNFLSTKRIDISKVITHKFKFSEFNKAFEILTSPEKNCGKILLIPD